jgi:hypothetical protein
VSHRKDFNSKLFDAIDAGLVSVLGREAVSSFYYNIEENHNISREEFKDRPVEVLEHLRVLLGESGFSILLVPILDQIKDTFAIEGKPLDVDAAIELAKKKYLLS